MNLGLQIVGRHLQQVHAEFAQGMSAPHNLPLQLTSFVGREREQVEIRSLLRATRLLTLTGSGGAGKTRLSIQLAAAVLDDYAHGAWFVDLAPVADGSLVPQTLASVLGVRELPGRPLIEALAQALATRQLLLLLDNCEHVLPACAGLTYSLLQACPRISVLTTTREPLDIAGETVWRVPSLTLPGSEAAVSLGQLRTSEAVRLFEERVRSTLPGINLSDRNAPAVAKICRRLEGIPLAIELAAARVKLLSVEQIAARLDDRFRLLSGGRRSAPTRQQTIRATIDWSYDLLSEPERLLFDRLSVFVGGWTLEAAEAVGAGGEIDAENVLDLLGRLVDKSLVVTEVSAHSSARYRTLETLREYGREQLGRRSSAEVEATEARHAEFFVQLAELAEPQIQGSGQLPWLESLDQEHGNIRTALRGRIARTDVEAAQRLAGAVRLFWMVRGYLSEGRAWLAEALASEERTGEAGQEILNGQHSTSAPPCQRFGAHLAIRAKALHGVGTLALFQGDYAAASAAEGEALAIWERLGNDAGASFSLLTLGDLEMSRGDIVRARRRLEAGVAAGRASGQPIPLALNLAFLSQVACDDGDFSGARRMGEEALQLSKQTGFGRAIRNSVLALSDLSYQEGDYDAARMLLNEALARARESGDRIHIASASATLGQLAVDAGDTVAAASFFQQSLSVSREVGDRRAIAQRLEDIARLAATMQHPADALRLAAGAAALRETIGTPIRRVEQTRLDACLAWAHTNLGEATAAKVWEKARSGPLEDATTTALELLDAARTTSSVGADPDRRTSERRRGGRGPDELTPREREVAVLMARGLSNRRIARDLVISEKTAANHVGHILEKLALESRTELAALWRAGDGAGTPG